MTAGRTAAQVAGAVLAALAITMLVGGVAAVAVAASNRDTDGYLTTPAYEMSADGHALTFGAADMQSATDGWVPWRALFTTRVSATADDGSAVFVGIGPAQEVAAYLAGVAHTQVSDLGVLPSSVETEDEPGSSAPPPPGEQEFWAAQTSGPGEQTVTWEPADGSWSVVVMNADGSPGLALAAGGGISVGVLWPIGFGLLAGGVVTLLLGVILLAIGSGGRRRAQRPAGPALAPTP